MRESKRRRGVALLITLAVIASMMALIAILFSYLNDVKDRANAQAALIQSDLMRSDMQLFLEKYLSSKDQKKRLKNLYSSAITLKGRGGKYRLTLRCQALFDRIPIVWLAWNQRGKDRIYYSLALGLFERLSQEAELKDPSRLLAMIQARLKGRHTTIGFADDLQNRPLEMTPDIFSKLIADYRFNSDDPRVYRIDWSRFFLLQTVGEAPLKLDRDFLAPQTIAYLYDIDPAIVQAEYRLGDIERLLHLGAIQNRSYERILSQKPQLALHCDLSYDFNKDRYNASFDYIRKRILNFELTKP